MVPVRCEPDVLGATVRFVLPLPVPLAGDGVIQLTLLVAAQGQLALLAVMGTGYPGSTFPLGSEVPPAP